MKVIGELLGGQNCNQWVVKLKPTPNFCRNGSAFDKIGVLFLKAVISSTGILRLSTYLPKCALVTRSIPNKVLRKRTQFYLTWGFPGVGHTGLTSNFGYSIHYSFSIILLPEIISIDLRLKCGTRFLEIRQWHLPSYT